MEVRQSGENYLVYIKKDESVMASLTEVCSTNEIKNGQVSGIGAVKDIEIGAYELKTKSYIKKQFLDIYELISFQGNITLKDGKPFIHSHITIGNHKLNTLGGHLFEMKVAVVGEFIIRKIDSDAYRKLDEEIGLPVWCLNL